jgi:hypothetical protein
VIESEGKFYVSILSKMQYDASIVGQAEVDWFFLLLQSGWKMVNAEWALGVAGSTGRPIVVCDIKSGRYFHFPTVVEAAATLTPDKSGGAGAIGPMLVRQQNQQYGLAARYATADEVELFRGATDVTSQLMRLKPSVDWTNGLARNSTLAWAAGSLRDSDIEQLKKGFRGHYSPSSPMTDYRGVSWHRARKGWQCRAKSGARGKEIWQTGPLISWRDEHDAAIYREKVIIENNWQGFNRGQQHGSNAALLNARVMDRLDGPLKDWESD